MKTTKEALEGVAEQAESLLKMDLPEEAIVKVEMILSIVRHPIDTQTQEETRE